MEEEVGSDAWYEQWYAKGYQKDPELERLMDEHFIRVDLPRPPPKPKPAVPPEQSAWASDRRHGHIYVASALCEAGIEFVIWGPMMLCYNAVSFWRRLDRSTADTSLEFVIENDMFDKAVDVIRDLGGVDCTYGTECMYNIERYNPDLDVRILFKAMHSFPRVHLHQKDQVRQVIQLHKQSDMLWWLPSLRPDGENVLMVDDKRLDWPMRSLAYFARDLPARVLAPHRVLEAIVRVYFRDRGYLTRLMWYHDLTGLVCSDDFDLVTGWEQLAPHFRDFVRALRKYDMIRVCDFRRLKAADESIVTSTGTRPDPYALKYDQEYLDVDDIDKLSESEVRDYDESWRAREEQRAARWEENRIKRMREIAEEQAATRRAANERAAMRRAAADRRPDSSGPA